MRLLHKTGFLIIVLTSLACGSAQAQSLRPPPLPAPASPPPLPPSVIAQFFIEEDGAPRGPFNLSQLEARARAGRLTQETLVWKDGMPDWTRAGDVPALFDILPAIPAETTEPTADMPAYLAGSWELNTESDGYQESTTIHFEPDGRYEGSVSSASSDENQAPVKHMVAGTWEITPIERDRFQLMLRPRDNGHPTAATLRIVDRDTLFNETVQATAYRITR